ncbi:MAG: MarR family transcriptional regulator [Enterocloster asparagiformis]|nr:MarR family transcriptional regulator [Enterocloster asparagiformis]
MEVNAMAKGGNPRHLELIRRINRSLILNMVKERQPVSRAQLARALNLSKTTVSSIVDELVRKKLLVEYGDCCAAFHQQPSSSPRQRNGILLPDLPVSRHALN